MNTTDPDIEFDKNGVCNHCRKYDDIIRKNMIPISKRKVELEKIISKIKEEGRDKKYDYIMGLSGGVDSSYVAYLANKYKLKPLAVHLDNGWNSEEAEANIKNIINKLEFNLYTYKVDWEEFKDLQRSYFKSSVVDIEVLTDNAIVNSIYKKALFKKYYTELSKIPDETYDAPIFWRENSPKLWSRRFCYTLMNYLCKPALRRGYWLKRDKEFKSIALKILSENAGFVKYNFPNMNFEEYFKKNPRAAENFIKMKLMMILSIS